MSRKPFHLNRRQLLQGIGAGLGAASLSSCIGDGSFELDSEFAGLHAANGNTPTDWRKLNEQIDHVVVLCMENRSFDHYYGAYTLPKDMGGVGLLHKDQGGVINGLKGHETNPSGLAQKDIKIHKNKHFVPHDLPHNWDEMHQMLRGFGSDGEMTGFVKAAENWAHEEFKALTKKNNIRGVAPFHTPRGPLIKNVDHLAQVMAEEAMGYHTHDQIPLMYRLANQYSLCQQYYSSVCGPTWTNRFYLHGATAEGLKDNIALGSVLPLLDLAFGWESILDIVEKRNGLEAMNFYHDLCWLRSANPDAGREFRRQFQRMVHKRDTNPGFFSKGPKGFLARARKGKLPALSIVDPHFGIFRGQDANDDHPDPGGADLHDVRKGQALIATVIKAIAEGPSWNNTVLMITYDEAGGFYDHDKPPTVFDKNPDFRQLGFRVPTLMIGPHTKRGGVTSATMEHASILKTIECLLGTERQSDGTFHFKKRFKDPAVRRRIDEASDMLSCFDANFAESRNKKNAKPNFNAVEISWSKWKNLPQSTYHEEMRASVNKMHHSIREEAQEPILDEVMAIGEELGAVKMKA